jgi:SWIM zinc finger
MKLTTHWLRSNATATSYDRGEEYEDSVRKLKKEGNTYTAKVEGSDTYKVEIIESDTEIYAECSCPYDHGGICKHIVAVGLSILSGNFTEVEPAKIAAIPASLLAEEVIDTATFYQKEFSKAKKKQQDAFIKLLFSQDANVCRQFLSYIRPPIVVPLSVSTDIEELSNEIASRLMEIETDDFMLEEEEEDYGRGRGYGRGRYDYYDDEEYEDKYDTEALGKEVLRLLEPYGKMSLQYLEKGQYLDSVRVLLAIYEAEFIVEDPDLDEYTEFSYIDEIGTFFQQATNDWIEKTIFKTMKKGDYEALLKLILDRWQHFIRFQGKEEAAPYEYLNDDLFYFIIQKAKAEQQFLDFMTTNKLHTSVHYELTKKLCATLDKPDFLLSKLAEYGLESPELAKELMLQYIERDNRTHFIDVAQKACEQFERRINIFVAEQVLPTDDLAFFKKIVSDVASREQRLDLFHHWREQVTPIEQEAYFELQKARNEYFYITLLADAKRFSDVLIFAEQNVEKSNTETFEKAAKWVFDVYPNEIFPLYCERIILYMGNSASSRSHYQRAVEKLKPLREIKGKEQDIKVFAADLRRKYNRLPAFLDELKRGGF